jgi:hypothetical protein
MQMKKSTLTLLSILISISVFSSQDYCNIVKTPKRYDNGQPAYSNYNGPIIIDEGGTYEGNWNSNDINIPTIQIMTDECVIIQNSCITGDGTLIYSSENNLFANISLINNYMERFTPTCYSDHNFPGNGAALVVHFPLTINVISNKIIGSNGIKIRNISDNASCTTSTETPVIRIKRNRVRNLDDRVYDSMCQMPLQNTGPNTYNGMSINTCTQGYSNEIYDTDPNKKWRIYKKKYAFFVIIRNLGVVDAEIEWNEVVNKPNESSVEDIINILGSSGTPGKAISIKNNFLWGAYPMGPVNTPYDAYGNQYYSGGGINVGDYKGTCPNATIDQYIDVENNIILGTTFSGIKVVIGKNINIKNNRIISSAQGPKKLKGSYMAISAQNRPWPMNFRSAGILIEDYQPPRCSMSSACGLTIHDYGLPHQGNYLKDGAVNNIGNVWRKNNCLSDITVVDNLIWWRRKYHSPSNISGTLAGPPNNTQGFKATGNWFYRESMPYPLPNDINNPAWFKALSIIWWTC